ncbi:hypothetical protein MalM25_05810 [Planctomycetes bacterium MalM25]|nr:hypothetical protein MalM25_05810 [Planctomycetes bacterium MalM25]
MRYTTLTALALTLTITAQANAVQVGAGQTSVLLDTDTLSNAAGLTLSSVSPGIGAGVIPGSVAFPINSRSAASLPTTFEYTAGDFPGGPFSGTIEHTGSVFFNMDTVEVGDFTIGFDAGRVSGANSGFFVESTTGVAAILFDAQVTGLNEASETLLDLEVDLVVSPEFAGFLGDTGLTGADVGDARIQAAVPEPASLLAVLAGLGAVALGRRR